MEDARDDTGDLRLGFVRGMLWGKILLTVAVQTVLVWQLRLPASAAYATTLPFIPLLLLLAGPRHGARRAVLVSAVALGCLVPFPILGWRWILLTPLAVCALIAFRSAAAWCSFTVVIAGTFAAGIGAGLDLGAAMNVAAGSASLALVIFGVDALAVAIARLHATRSEVTREHLAAERRRLDEGLRAAVGSRLQDLCDLLSPDAGDLFEPSDARSARIAAAAEHARQVLATIRSTAGGHRRAAPPETTISSPFLARMTLIILYALEVQYCFVADLDDFHRPWAAAAVGVWTTGVGVLLLAEQLSSRRMASAASMLVIPLFLFGPTVGEVGRSIVFLPFFAGVALVRMQRPYSWIVAVLATVSFTVATLIAFLWTGQVHGMPQLVGNLVFFAGHSWATYSLLRLAELVKLQHRTRADLVRDAIVRERTQVARDLHDVLSFSLSAIALKADLCLRLLAVGSDTADRHLAELAGLARRARAELGVLVDHRRIALRLDEELATAQAMLTWSGTHVTISVDDLGTASETGNALAGVLREAVTNVVRHSRARTCSIAVVRTPDAIRLRVVNDGVHLPANAAGRQAGSGLLGMAERTGGRLAARPLPHGRYELIAEFGLDAGVVSSADPLAAA
ncbi:sensor histidine kinase [Catenulispora subtropica]|uniref:Signal transduction histidine kinase subgroup 3 dimerisation and phosphoacceptor domain-containing protein n=1 Tax=Catenulispora subtropica TaxID=450798 RepID=A0ABN2R992_9ACTN